MTTPNWDFLLAEAGLAAMLPKEYSHFARPIRDGLTIFLGGLPAVDQEEILRAQASLPPNASITQRLGFLARSSPVLQKLGQVLARDQRLSLDLRLHLQQLESLPPTIPLETIQAILTQELGPLDRRGVTLMPPALAEASVAVVIPFQQETGRAAGGEDTYGVFKVLKPGIEDRLQFELGLLQRVGEHLDQRCDELKIPHLHYQEAFAQVRDKLVDEVQLENEQRHLGLAKQLFAAEPMVQIPEVFAHCSSRVTAMSRVSGGKVTDHRLVARHKRRRLATMIARALIAKPVFSRSSNALFHGDPHAGNLFFTDDGRLAILDWSLVGRLGARERETIVQVLLGAITLDDQGIVRLLAGLSGRQLADAAALSAVVRTWLQGVRRGQFPGFSWLTGMLDDAVQNAKLAVTADLMLFRKTLHTVAGLLVDVGAGDVLDEVLFTEFLSHFVAEWPQRWLQSPSSRDFSTHLSNLDLARTLCSGPTAATRYWTGHARDVMHGFADKLPAGQCVAPPSDVDEPQGGYKADFNSPSETTCPSNV